MTLVLVTGGTGRLGSLRVAELRARGHEVRVLSRHPGPGHVVGDLADGSGIAGAVDEVDVVVHVATSAKLNAVDVRGTARLTAAARSAGVEHLIYVSIVGVDRNPFRYYRAKLAAEGVVESSRVPYTLARGTQFFDLVAAVADRLRVRSSWFAPSGWRVEPHAPADFAAWLADQVEEGPSGEVTEFGGPQEFTAAQLVASWHRVRGRTGRVREIRLPGRVSAAWRAGAQVSAADAARGSTTWDIWLRSRSF